MSTRDEYVDIIKTAVATVLKRQLISKLVAMLPFLAGGFWSPIVAFIIGKIVGEAVEEAEMRAFFKFIDMRGMMQSKDFEAAAYNNYNVQRTGTPQEKLNAEKNLMSALSKFAVLTN